MRAAALLTVREDRKAADQLTSLLEGQGLIIDRSATALESPADFEAAIVLFSPAAVRSSLLLWAAKQALDCHKLIPVFTSLAALPRAFSRMPIHDLSEWAGDDDHSAITAIRRHLARLSRVRSDGAALEQVGRAGRAFANEPPAPILAPPTFNEPEPPHPRELMHEADLPHYQPEACLSSEQGAFRVSSDAASRRRRMILLSRRQMGLPTA